MISILFPRGKYGELWSRYFPVKNLIRSDPCLLGFESCLFGFDWWFFGFEWWLFGSQSCLFGLDCYIFGFTFQWTLTVLSYRPFHWLSPPTVGVQLILKQWTIPVSLCAPLVTRSKMTQTGYFSNLCAWRMELGVEKYTNVLVRVRATK